MAVKVAQGKRSLYRSDFKQLKTTFFSPPSSENIHSFKIHLQNASELKGMRFLHHLVLLSMIPDILITILLYIYNNKNYK